LRPLFLFQSGVEPPQSKAFGSGGCHGAVPTSCKPTSPPREPTMLPGFDRPTRRSALQTFSPHAWRDRLRPVRLLVVTADAEVGPPDLFPTPGGRRVAPPNSPGAGSRRHDMPPSRLYSHAWRDRLRPVRLRSVRGRRGGTHSALDSRDQQLKPSGSLDHDVGDGQGGANRVLFSSCRGRSNCANRPVDRSGLGASSREAPSKNASRAIASL
jgi:hypothetical protein